MGVVEPGIGTIERELTGALGAWATGSVVIGAALAVVGRATGLPVISGFARQQVAWGAVDGAIAGFGLVRSRGQAPDGVSIVDDGDRPDAAAQARAAKLERVLLVNSGLDVAYVAGGIALAAAAPAVARRTGRDAERLVGDGLGIVVQGGFLLALDTFFARRVRHFRALAQTPVPGHRRLYAVDGPEANATGS
jgi:hypothetical protein